MYQGGFAHSNMRSVSRGVLAAVGIVAGFMTLVFLSQTGRYFQRALYGTSMGLGMFGIYVILSYCGIAVTAVSFKPEFRVAKYLAGFGVGVGGLMLLGALILFTSDISSGMLLFIYMIFQLIAAGMVYGVAQALNDDENESTETDI
jgi:hypothetical protein